MMKVPVGIGYLQKMQNNYGKKGSKQGHPVSRSIDSTLFLLFILLSSIANLNTDFTNKKLTYILSKKKKRTWCWLSTQNYSSPYPEGGRKNPCNKLLQSPS